MAVKRVLEFPAEEAALREKSSEVKFLNNNIKTLIKDLRDTLAEQPGAGLAAPQIGVHKQVALVMFGQDEGEKQEPIVIINPEIIERGPLVKGFDGCLSLPGIVTWDTLRPEWLVFKARNEQFQEFTMRVEGIDARVVDHEVDHLEGIFFLDKLVSGGKLYIPRVDENGKEKLVELTGLFTR